MTVWVVILAGGVGSRFWPLSTPERPKQFLPLVSDQPLLVDTVHRMAPLAGPDHTLILTSGSLVPGIRELAPQIPRDNVIAEPRPAGTAAALTWAASRIQAREGAEAVMISVHADWAVSDPERYRETLRRAASVAAERGLLVTVGVVPRRPDPGLGYIRPGERLDAGAHRVAAFVEKPDRAHAATLIAEGCLWNSGIFVWRVGDFLDEVNARTPEVAVALASSPTDAQAFFAAVRSVSVDVGVLERSARVAVVRGDFGWDDVGTWAALLRTRVLDGSGNALFGPAHAMKSTGNVVHCGGTEVVLFGVSGLVVVAHGDVTLVTTVERAADLKELVEALPSHLGRPA